MGESGTAFKEPASRPQPWRGRIIRVISGGDGGYREIQTKEDKPAKKLAKALRKNDPTLDRRPKFKD